MLRLAISSANAEPEWRAEEGVLPDLHMAFAQTIAKTHSHYSFGHETSWKTLEGIQLWRAYANFYGTCETNWG